MAKKDRKLARQKRQEKRQATRLLKQIKKRQPKPKQKQKYILPKGPRLSQNEQIRNTLNYIQGNPNITSSQE